MVLVDFVQHQVVTRQDVIHLDVGQAAIAARQVAERVTHKHLQHVTSDQHHYTLKCNHAVHGNAVNSLDAILYKYKYIMIM